MPGSRCSTPLSFLRRPCDAVRLALPSQGTPMRLGLRPASQLCFAPLAILFFNSSLVLAQGSSRQDFSQRFAALATAAGLSDSAKLHRLFDLDWEYSNVAYPENATYTGYPGQNDR